MSGAPEKSTSNADFSDQPVAELQSVIAGLQAQLRQRDIRIELLEEMLRLKRIQQFAARSEKSAYQIALFDEAETQVEMAALAEHLPEQDKPETAARPRKKRRQRGFSDTLPRERIELTLPDTDKAGARKVFFAKVKEELDYIPAQLKVLEYWQCQRCRHQTTVTSGTIFDSTKLPLTVWFLAMHLLTQAKNNVSALDLRRQLGVSYRAAWRIKHKLMQVMAKRESRRQLSGRVEIDDAYLGGEHPGKRGRGSPNKVPFVIAVSTVDGRAANPIKW